MNFDATFTTAGNPYNIYNVLSGLQTTGVTKQTGSKNFNISRNVSVLRITVDGVVAGIVYVTSDATVSATNKVGNPILSGDSRIFQGEGNMRSFSIANRYFAVDSNLMLIHFEVE